MHNTNHEVITKPSSITEPEASTGKDQIMDPDDRRHAEKLFKIIRKRSFCTLATTSAAGRSHSAGVVYDSVDGDLWIHTMRTSRKARNVESSGHVGVSLAFRRLPAGPPFTIHYQAEARIVSMADDEVRTLIQRGELSHVSGHGALETEDGCFIKISRPRTIHSYGPGASVIGLIRDPLNNGARSITLDAGSALEPGVLR